MDAVVRGLVCGWGGSLREVEGAEERGVGAGVEGLLGGALGGVGDAERCRVIQSPALVFTSGYPSGIRGVRVGGGVGDVDDPAARSCSSARLSRVRGALVHDSGSLTSA